VNFTREPIIETIVSPKDGYKLCIRNSKVSGSDEFFVDAVEVVSFGSSFFYRGQERPKPFLVPVSDYEIFEVKETRVILKNVSHDRNIKIGGGREASLKSSKESVVEKKIEVKEVEEVAEVDSAEPKTDKKRDRRRSRRRRVAEEKRTDGDKSSDDQESLENTDDAPASPAVALVVPTFSQLLPPPSVLISERLNQLRAQEIAEGLVTGSTLDEDGNEVLGDQVSVEEPVKPMSDEIISEELSIEEEMVSEETSVDGNVDSEEATHEHAKVNNQDDENFNF